MAGTDREAGSGHDSMPQIVQTPDVLDGDPRIEGTRVGVAHVYRRYVDGEESPADIAAGYDISLAAVHAALAYGFANTDELESIAARNRQRREAADSLTPAEE